MRHLLFLVLVGPAGLAGCSGCATTPTSSATTSTPSPTATSQGRPPARPDPLIEVPGLSDLHRRPLVVLFEWTPRLDVIGSDMPTIVVYEDGLIIQNSLATDRGPRWNGLRGQIEPSDAMAFVRALATPEFLGLPRHMADHVDMHSPTVAIALRQGVKWKRVAVSGLRRDSPVSRDPQIAAFDKTYRALLSPDVPEGLRWIPEEIEIMLWGFAHAREVVPWPADLPPLPKTWLPPPDDAGVYKHVVHGKHEDAVRMFLREHGQKAVVVNGIKCAMGVRRLAPEESYIRRVFSMESSSPNPPQATP